MYTPLSDVLYTNKPAGSKVTNLATLQNVGFRVPPSIVVYNDELLVADYDYAERLGTASQYAHRGWPRMGLSPHMQANTTRSFMSSVRTYTSVS